jgi:hypothetical protein
LHRGQLYPHRVANPRAQACAGGPEPARRVVRLPTKESTMHLTAAHIAPIVSLIAGILILIVPRLLNYIVAIYLIVVGLVGLNAIHHFAR